MALKIRLTRIGAVHTPIYRVIVAEARSRRDGRPVEQVGTYQPKLSSTPLTLDLARVDYWVSKGAQPTNTVVGLIKRARLKAAAAPAPAAAAV